MIVGKIQNRSCYQNLSNGSKFQDNCSIMVIIPISLLLESWFLCYLIYLYNLFCSGKLMPGKLAPVTSLSMPTYLHISPLG